MAGMLSFSRRPSRTQPTRDSVYFMTLKWRGVCKFLAGAFFVNAGILFYLYVTGTPVPLIGTHLIVEPETNGIRSTIYAILFLVTFYFGFIRNKGSGSRLVSKTEMQPGPPPRLSIGLGCPNGIVLAKKLTALISEVTLSVAIGAPAQRSLREPHCRSDVNSSGGKLHGTHTFTAMAGHRR